MEKLKVGDLVHTNMYNVCIDKFDAVGGLVGKIKHVDSNDRFEVYVDPIRYPFYTGSELLSNGYKYVCCNKYNGARKYHVNKLNNTIDSYQIY